MKATRCSGLCAMRAERGDRRRRWRRWALAGLAAPLAAFAAEAPPADVLPPEAESAYQDLSAQAAERVPLDEAIFTEISPLTVPELGIRLPPDQEL